MQKSPDSNSSNKTKKVLRTILIVLAGIVGIGGIAAAVYVISLLGEIPDVRTLENLRIAQSTVIYDRNGNELYKVHGEENRKYIPLSEISEFVKQATIAIEDKEFYKHEGYDLNGMVRSVIYNVTHPDERVRSGSTITQQLVKNVFLTPEVSLRRKLKELIMSYQLEQTYSKDKILELYLNQIPYGSNAYGIEMAAQIYFGKKAKDLNLQESAILASLPRGPSYYSPHGPNRDILMGYCKPDKQTETDSEFTEDKKEETAGLSVQIKAKERVWIRINYDDGKKREEITLPKGEVKTYTADQSLGFLLGNKNNVEVSYQGFVFKPLASTSFVVTATTVRDFLTEPELLDKKMLTEAEQKVKASCSNMEQEEYVLGRKDLVLQAMQKEGYITLEQMQKAWNDSKTIQFNKLVERIKYPHFVMYVKDYLEDKYGQEVVEKGGLQVKTTLDPALQDLAQGIIDKNIDGLEKKYKLSNMAVLSANPKTGQILTMIGSRDYFNEKYDGNVNIVLARRQPGSSFKPFTYAAAFLNGYGAGTVLWDVRTQFGQGTPPNNADGAFLGPLTIRKALAWSRNIPAIKAYYLAGEEDRFLDFLEPFGFGYLKTDREAARKNDPGYSYGWPMGIGSAEVRMFDMVQGYAVFANGGVRKELTPILEIRDKDGNIIEQYNDQAGRSQVLDPQVAFLINDILSDAQARPAGYWRDRITVPNKQVAVKTGTSNKRINKNLILPSDDWTMGYSTTLVTGMWGGNADGSPMTGAAFDINTIAVLWKQYMTEALKDTPSEQFPVPDGITKVTVNRLSGKRASQNTPSDFQVSDFFPSFGVPKEFDNSFSAVKVDTRNNLLANQDCPPTVVENKYVLNLHEAIDRPGWDEAINGWVRSHAEAFPQVLLDIPKEDSPLCEPVTEEQKPTISIVSPLSFGEVARGNINVFVNTSAFFGIDRVEYYWDDQLVATAKEHPYAGGITIPPETPVDSTHTIRAVVFDTRQYSSESSIQVKITEKDTSPPHITFVAPQDGATVPMNTTLVLEAQAYDDNSAITQVDFLLDGSLLGSRKTAPYKQSVFFDDKISAGEHTLTAKATDSYGNSDSVSLKVTFTSAATETSFGISTPNSGSFVQKNTAQQVSFHVQGGNIKNVTLIARRSDGLSTTVHSIDNPSAVGSSFVAYWTPATAGDYELFLKVTDHQDELSYSERVFVTVE